MEKISRMLRQGRESERGGTVSERRGTENHNGLVVVKAYRFQPFALIANMELLLFETPESIGPGATRACDDISQHVATESPGRASYRDAVAAVGIGIQGETRSAEPGP